MARYGYLPSFGLDFFYGIDANQFAANSADSAIRDAAPQPNYQVMNRQNLGYSGQATLNIPVWNWGATRSKVKQAEFKEAAGQGGSYRRPAHAAREPGRRLCAKPEAAQAQIDSLRSSVDLSVESLRLTLLRYQAGEATALEVWTRKPLSPRRATPMTTVWCATSGAGQLCRL